MKKSRETMRLNSAFLCAVLVVLFTTCSIDGDLGSLRKKVGIDMVRIYPGTFTMGSPTTEPGRSSNETQHRVTLTEGFYISKYQVTQAQWHKVMGTTIQQQQAEATDIIVNYGRGDKYPVYYVSWYDAIVFCNKLSMREGLKPAYYISGGTNPASWGTVPTSSNAAWDSVQIVMNSNGYRLPTEAQWEYACRAGRTAGYNWGTNYINSSQANFNASNVDDCNTVAGTYLQRTTEVGSYAPNTWVLYDMHGNVREWCWDWYDINYGGTAGASVDNPTGASSGTSRVNRGGGWNSNDGRFLRSAYRNFNNPNIQSSGIGLRIVRP